MEKKNIQLTCASPVCSGASALPQSGTQLSSRNTESEDIAVKNQTKEDLESIPVHEKNRENFILKPFSYAVLLIGIHLLFHNGTRVRHVVHKHEIVLIFCCFCFKKACIGFRIRDGKNTGSGIRDEHPGYYV